MAETHPDFPARALQQEGSVEREGEERGGEGERGRGGVGGDVKGYGKEFGCIGNMLFHRIAVVL